MKQKSNVLFGIVKGAIISIGALLPGISGGALCVIMGIYKPLMQLLGEFPALVKQAIGWLMAKLKKTAVPDDGGKLAGYIRFFWPVGVGMVIGMLGIAKLLGVLLDKYETEGLFLFVGLILGTLPGLLKEARQQGVSKNSWIAMFGLMALMLAWMIPMTMGGQAQIVPNFFWWCVCGVLWGMGIIIPGMSPSNIFLFLGLAEPMYAAIGRLDMSVIIPMGLFLVLGIVALSKSINFCLNKHYSVFMHAIVGVVLASTVIIIPPVKMALDPTYTFSMGAGNWVVYILCLAAGALSAWGLERWKQD